MSRRFITKDDVDRLVDAGESQLVVDRRTTVTDLAREHAMQSGFTIVEQPGDTPARTLGGGASEEQVRAEVRSAVIAALGEVPPGLDRAVQKALQQRQ